MKLSTIMTKNAGFIYEQHNLQEAAHQMWEGDFGALPVVNNDQQIIGMLTDRDIAMAAYTQGMKLTDIKVKSAMSREVFVGKENDDLASALETMRKHKVRRLPIVDKGNHIKGILSLNDIAVAFRKSGQDVKALEVATTLAKICEHRVPEKVQTAA